MTEHLPSEGLAFSQQLLAALTAISQLQQQVGRLEARLAAHETQQPRTDTRSSAMPYLQSHEGLHLPQPKPSDHLGNGSAPTRARQLQQETTASCGIGNQPGHPPMPAGGTVPRPLDAEVPMSATRIVMTQIVPTSESNGLDICTVRYFWCVHGWRTSGHLLKWCSACESHWTCPRV
jgi:hypothetical protein